MAPRCNASPRNVVNAPARAADLHKTTFTDDDKTALTQLSTVALDMKQGTAAAGATGPGSPLLRSSRRWSPRPVWSTPRPRCAALWRPTPWQNEGMDRSGAAGVLEGIAHLTTRRGVASLTPQA